MTAVEVQAQTENDTTRKKVELEGGRDRVWGCAFYNVHNKESYMGEVAILVIEKTFQIIVSYHYESAC